MAGSQRSEPTLYSDPEGLESHRVRFVLAEKGISYRNIDTAPSVAGPELLAQNASGSVPTLVDRDLALYDGRVIVDYLDERVPHPPLMPMDPTARARTRVAAYRMQRDWDSLLPSDGKMTNQDRGRLVTALEESADVFAALPHFLSQDFSVLDTLLGPLLWRLPRYGIVLSETAEPIAAYAQRLFARPGFQASLSGAERAMDESGKTGE